MKKCNAFWLPFQKIYSLCIIFPLCASIPTSCAKNSAAPYTRKHIRGFRVHTYRSRIDLLGIATGALRASDRA